VFREDQQQPVMQPNGLVDLFVDLPPAFNVVGYSFGLGGFSLAPSSARIAPL
jgi:hypothetical protein